MNTRLITLIAGWVVGFLLTAACNRGNPDQLPVDFVRDRVVCEECGMALSDPRYSVQVVHPKGTPYFFDDIGCAVVWMRNKSWRQKARTWVKDVNTKEWIEAQNANWRFGDENTPMGYGFAATLSPVKDRLDFETVQKWIYIGKTMIHRNALKHLGLGHPYPVGRSPNQQKTDTRPKIKGN